MADETGVNSDPNTAPAPTALTGRERSIAALAPYKWVKGAPSPNPGGRPKGVRLRLAELTNGGEDMLQILVDVALGRKSAKREQLDAIRMASERLWGRTPETVLTGQLSDEATAQASGLSDDELETVLRWAKTGT